MKVFNQEKALVGAFSVIMNLRVDPRFQLYWGGAGGRDYRHVTIPPHGSSSYFQQPGLRGIRTKDRGGRGASDAGQQQATGDVRSRGRGGAG